MSRTLPLLALLAACATSGGSHADDTTPSAVLTSCLGDCAQQAAGCATTDDAGCKDLCDAQDMLVSSPSCVDLYTAYHDCLAGTTYTCDTLGNATPNDIGACSDERDAWWNSGC